jgi:sec-independent protein translocase protein TatC
MSGATTTSRAETQTIPAEILEKYMPLLVELRRKLFGVSLVFVASSIAGFIFYQPLLRTVMNLFDLKGIQIVLTSPYQFFTLAITTGLMVGVAFTFPLLVYHLMQFIRPALQEREYRVLVRALPLSFGLLISGFVFGIWVMTFVISLFAQTTVDFNVSNIWDISQFYSQIMFTAVSLAVVFQFPLIIAIATRLGLVKEKALTKNRPLIYAGALIFAALLPPTDPFSLALMTIPLIFLFEASLLINRLGYFG